MESQSHLGKKQQIDLGSFYTPSHLVDIVYDMISKNVSAPNEYTIVDSSCGYGSFIRKNSQYHRTVGADIDKEAVQVAKREEKGADFYICDALRDINREKYNLASDEKIIIVGNPPYNDNTSILRHDIKDHNQQKNMDFDIRTRDLGMSFILSYNKLEADYVCILHPLSYLIKKANFSAIRKFMDNYKLIEGTIVSSHEFSDTSRGMAFPIVIAFYKRGEKTTYKDIETFLFNVDDNQTFRLSDFNSISKFVQKYPNKYKLTKNDEVVAKFYTLRDINALKRSRTFIDNDMSNTVYVTKDQFAYYCYIDTFKRRIADRLPYYFGNCDIMIDDDEFKKIKESFIYDSVNNNYVLRKQFKYKKIEDSEKNINKYFTKLLGDYL